MIRSLIVLTVLCFAAPALAEPAAGPAPVSQQDYISQVLDLNRVPPQQNPLYMMGNKVLAYRLLDRNRRALGKMQDITLGADGSLQSIQVHMIAPGFNEELSFDIKAYNATPESDAYVVSLSRDQVEQNLPDLLAGIETAAGESQPITVQSLVGARVQTDRGRQIATVQDVVIDDDRKVAVALLLTMLGGNQTVAVPYKTSRIERRGPKATVELSEAQAKVASSYGAKR